MYAKKVCIGIGIGIGGCGGCGGCGCGGIKWMSVCISSSLDGGTVDRRNNVCNSSLDGGTVDRRNNVCNSSLDGGTVDRRNNVCNSSLDGNGKSISRFEPSESVFRIRIICICWGG